MLGAIAQWEKSVIVQKLRAARLRIRRDRGRCEGRKPYGLSASEQETITRMRELRRTGLSYEAIATELNASGITPRTTLRTGKQTKWYGAASSEFGSHSIKGQSHLIPCLLTRASNLRPKTSPIHSR
jgi:DNA invertase Pin-like site-specific DNA recombinase